MSVFHELTAKRDEIIRIGLGHGAVNVRIFGSVAREEDGPDSDIDMLVSMEKGRSYFDLIGFQHELEDIFGRKVDMLSDKGLSPYIADRILSEARPI